MMRILQSIDEEFFTEHVVNILFKEVSSCPIPPAVSQSGNTCSLCKNMQSVWGLTSFRGRVKEHRFGICFVPTRLGRWPV